jgi:hypothetical protein
MGTALEASQIYTDYPEHSSSTEESSSLIEVQSPAVDGKGKGIVLIVPECTSQVCRSTRSNNYDGFNHKNLSEARTVKSKVKPRKIPTVKQKIRKNKKLVNSATLHLDPDALKETPIPLLQSIGVNLYGVPPEEISEEQLLALPMEKDRTEETTAMQSEDTA